MHNSNDQAPKPVNLTTTTTVKPQPSSSSSTTTSTTQTTMSNQKAPVDNAKAETIDQAVARLATYPFGTCQIVGDPGDKTIEDKTTKRVSPFKWLLVRLPNHEFIKADGLLILSLKVALHKKANGNYSIKIARPDTDGYDDFANFSICTSFNVMGDIPELLDGEICDVATTAGWEDQAIKVLCNKLRNGIFTQKQVDAALMADKERKAMIAKVTTDYEVARLKDPNMESPLKSVDALTKFAGAEISAKLVRLKNEAAAFLTSKQRIDVTPINFVPRDLCESVASATEVMKSKGCTINNQSAYNEFLRMTSSAFHATQKVFRYSGMHALKLSHVTIIGKIPNAKNPDGQGSIKTETVRVIPLNIGSEVLLVSVAGTGYGSSFPDKTTIEAHAKMLREAITCVENINKIAELMPPAEQLMPLTEQLCHQGKNGDRFWPKLIKSLRLDFRPIWWYSDVEEEKHHIIAALQSALVYCNVLLCAEDPGNTELKQILLMFLGAARRCDSDIAWSLLSTLSRTWEKGIACGEAYDLLAWHQDSRKEDDSSLNLREYAQIRQSYMLADLNIMIAEMSDKTSAKEQALADSKNLDTQLADAHADYNNRCKSVIEQQSQDAKFNNLADLNNSTVAMRNTHTQTTSNANVAPNVPSSAVRKSSAIPENNASNIRNTAFTNPSSRIRRHNGTNTTNIGGTVKSSATTTTAATSTSTSTNIHAQQTQQSSNAPRPPITAGAQNNTITPVGMESLFTFAPQTLELPSSSGVSETIAQVPSSRQLRNSTVLDSSNIFATKDLTRLQHRTNLPNPRLARVKWPDQSNQQSQMMTLFAQLTPAQQAAMVEQMKKNQQNVPDEKTTPPSANEKK